MPDACEEDCDSSRDASSSAPPNASGSPAISPARVPRQRGHVIEGCGKRRRLALRVLKGPARAVRAGVAVLPVTGRPRSGLPEEVLAIPGVRYAITSNGAMCEDLAEDKVLVRLAMDEETAMRALRIAEKYDVVIDIYIDGQAYTAADSMRLVQTHVPESFRPYFLKTRRLVEDRGRFLRQTAAGRKVHHPVSGHGPAGGGLEGVSSTRACSSFRRNPGEYRGER